MRSIHLRGVLAVVTLIVALVVLSTATKSGDIVEWRVLTLSGHAQARLDDRPFHPLGVGDALPPGTEILTDAGSRMTIAHGKDRLMVAPATRLQIARPTPGTVWDRLLQSFGSVIYDVEPRKDRTFGVDAPYLAAVVKGTRFQVTVRKDMASVHVERGKVEVASSDGVAKVLLLAGQTATASPTQIRGLQLSSAGIPVGTVVLNDATAPVEGTGASVTGAANSPTGVVTGTVDSVTGAVTGTVSAVSSTVSGTVQAVGGVVTAATNTVGGVVNSATSAVGGVVDSTTSAAGGVVSGVTGTATSAVGGVVSDVTGAVGGVTGSTSTSGTSTTSSSTTSSSSTSTSTGSSRGGLGGVLGGLL